jgi:hypothetical protein
MRAQTPGLVKTQSPDSSNAEKSSFNQACQKELPPGKRKWDCILLTSQALGNNEEGSNTPASLNPECRSLRSVPTLFPYFKIAAQPNFRFAS